MQTTIAREVKPMLLPMAGVVALGWSLGWLVGGEPGLPIVAWLAGCAYLCSLPFALEFQHRTLGLLFSQPIPRFLLWRRKTLMIAVAVGILAVGFLIGTLLEGTTDDLFIGFLFSVSASACSACLWTLIARTAIGGAVFALAAQLLLVVLMNYAAALVQRFRSDVGTDWLFWTITPLYCIACVWFGWRRFRALEVAEAMELQARLPRRISFGVFRISSGNPGRNLFAKELVLYRPVFLAGAGFCAAWVGMFGLRFFFPRWALDDLFIASAIVAIAVVPVIVGSLSVAEERTLRTLEWHRTLPVTIRRQWLAKVIVAVMVTCLLCLVAGLFLAIYSWQPGFSPGVLPNLIFVAGAGLTVLAVSTWASSFTSTTVGAAAIALASSAGLFLLVALGSRTGMALEQAVSLPMLWIMAGAQLLSDDLAWMRDCSATLQFISWFAVAALVAFEESYRLYRSPGKRANRFGLLTGILCVMLVVGGLIVFGLYTALLLALVIPLLRVVAQKRWPSLFTPREVSMPIVSAIILGGAVLLNSVVFSAVETGIAALVSRGEPESAIFGAMQRVTRAMPAWQRGESITVEQLRETGDLPGYAEWWLRGANIEVFRGPETSHVRVELPNGKQFERLLVHTEEPGAARGPAR